VRRTVLFISKKLKNYEQILKNQQESQKSFLGAKKLIKAYNFPPSPSQRQNVKNMHFKTNKIMNNKFFHSV
jgi:hypothetical protein